ncbi:metallophosphoesterase family protein [Mesobacillus jeotgali]|uniref:metallophosphoesterase family protein n=1 Tax=Mesobacillus jeotgali TaxID=129985 RepID=UPI000C825AA8|nr:metallophosphoesterase [Mesobacillus jeotgali]
MLNILHLSDLHFPVENMVAFESDFTNYLCELIESLGEEDFYFLISGDITFRGQEQGYKDASRIFRNIIQRCSPQLKRERIIVCPGNHDIVSNGKFRPFELLDGFTSEIRRDNFFSFTNQNQKILETEDALFLVINSSYNLDRRYGLINMDDLRISLRQASLDKDRIKVVVVHHHLINQFQHDTSAIRNAYEFIHLLDYYGFNVILHGHQHNNMDLPIGKSNMFIFGVNTPGFENPGYTNGISYYSISKNIVRRKQYIFSKDNQVGARIGGFKIVEENSYESI